MWLAVVLGGVSVRGGAEHGIGARWDHHGRSRMALVHSGLHAGSVIGAVAQEELDRVGDLVEQGTDLRGVIDVAVGQEGGDDPAGHRVKANVQFAPGTPLLVPCFSTSTPPSFSLTRRFGCGIWWRRSALALCGMKARSDRQEQPLPTPI